MLRLRIPHRRTVSLLKDAQGAAMLEFAISLPLLVVFVVGIYDFSGAFNQKQKIEQAAQEGAIIAGAQPTSDIASPTAPGLAAAGGVGSFQFAGWQWSSAEREPGTCNARHRVRPAQPGWLDVELHDFRVYRCLSWRQSGHHHQPRDGSHLGVAGARRHQRSSSISISLAFQ